MKTIALFVTSALMCFAASAQDMYIKFGGGYSFPAAAYPLGENASFHYSRITNPETGFYDPYLETTKKEVRGSFNSGAISTLSIGYRFPSNIATEINIGYVSGRGYQATDSYVESIDGEVINSDASIKSWDSRNLFIAPTLVISTGTERVLRPYLSAGVVFAAAQVNESQDDRSSLDENWPELMRKEEYTGGISIGLRGGLGVDVRLGKKTFAFAEAIYTGLSFSPKERNTVAYSENGQDALESLAVSMRKIRFVKSVSYDSEGGAQSPDEPSKALRMSFGMSAIAASAGLKIMI